ncbi:hypothetical protein C7H85_15810 [Zobellella endophytica]|uniref:Uncharacterized protein n=1 Tax=Zobellella endophytica TaxID=2116700 RepID=A0A2P7R0G3_9GAMM|nr:hypothetical protein C7H85_15810 [Zobellella endophytica]
MIVDGQPCRTLPVCLRCERALVFGGDPRFVLKFRILEQVGSGQLLENDMDVSASPALVKE